MEMWQCFIEGTGYPKKTYYQIKGIFCWDTMYTRFQSFQESRFSDFILLQEIQYITDEKDDKKKKAALGRKKLT